MPTTRHSTMTQYSPSTQAALLKWVGTFDTVRRAQSLQDLRDGVILGQMLEQMLGTEFHSDSLIQSPRSDDEIRQNLEAVYRGLAGFLRVDNPSLAPSPSEFRSIAESLDDNALCEFLSYFLSAACLGSLSTTYVPKVMKLDQQTQAEIAKIITEKNQLKTETEEQEEEPQSESVDDFENVYPVRDPELMAEELEQMRDKIEILKRQNADLQTRIEKLMDTREALLGDLRMAQDELSTLKRARGSDVSSTIRDLRNEIREKMVEIDRLEDLLEKETARANKLEKENENLRAKAARVKDLEDKVTVLEHETKQQQQMIKGLENYKKKAQDLTAIQQRNRLLDEQILQLEQELKMFEEVKAQNRRLQREIDEKMKVLSNNEQEIIYTLQSKNHLQEANEELKRRIEYLESKRQLDEETIEKLQEQLHYYESSGAAAAGPLSLEEELEGGGGGDPSVALRLEIQRLKAENNLLRNNMTVASENERLRGELDTATQKIDHYRLKCTEAMQQHAVIEEQLTALMNHATTESDVAFVNMRKELTAATRELEKARKHMQDLEREAADRERELLRLKADLEAVGKDETAALAALKASDELISESLRTELEATRKQLQHRVFEYDQMKEQFMETLVSKDRVQKKLEEALANTGEGPKGEMAQKGRKEDAEKIEKLKAALRQKIEQLEKAEQEKYDLQRRLKLAETKAASDQMIRNLQRENAMIATAWYDLTSRLQSNHVVLQRRHDAPRSWVNKQRQMVYGKATPRR